MTEFKLAGIVSAVGLGLGYFLGGRSSKVMEAEGKPKLTPKQLEYLNEMKTNYNGYAYVKTDKRGWDGLKPNVLEQLINKKIISIPRENNGGFVERLDNLSAYSVIINPIALKYPYTEPKGYEHYGGALRGTDKFAEYMAKQQPSQKDSSAQGNMDFEFVQVAEYHDASKNSHKYYATVIADGEVYSVYGRLPNWGREMTVSIIGPQGASTGSQNFKKKLKKGYQKVPIDFNNPKKEEKMAKTIYNKIREKFPPKSEPKQEEPKKPMNARLAMAMKRRQMMGAEGTLYTAGKWRRPVKFRHLDDKKYDGAIELQGYGFSPAKLGENLQIGDVLVWNNGYKSRILDIQPKGKQSLVLKTMTQDTRYKKGEEFERTIRKNRLVGVAQDFHKFNGVMIGDLPPVAGQPQPQNARLAMAMKRRQMMKAEDSDFKLYYLVEMPQRDYLDNFSTLEEAQFAWKELPHREHFIIVERNPMKNKEREMPRFGADQALLLDEEDDGELMGAEGKMSFDEKIKHLASYYGVGGLYIKRKYKKGEKLGEMLDDLGIRRGMVQESRIKNEAVHQNKYEYLGVSDWNSSEKVVKAFIEQLRKEGKIISTRCAVCKDQFPPMFLFKKIAPKTGEKITVCKGCKSFFEAEYQPDQEIADYSVSEIAKSSAIEGYQPNKYSFGPISLGAESVSDLKLKKDSCCCGATKKTPCVCMVLGSDCSAKKPMCACYRLKAIQEKDKKAAESSDSIPKPNPADKEETFAWVKREHPHIKTEADKEMDEYNYAALTYHPEELESGAVNALKAGDLEAAQNFVKAINRQKFIKAFQAEGNMEGMKLSYSSPARNTQYCISFDPFFTAGICRISPDRYGNTRGSYGFAGLGMPTCRHCIKTWKNMTPQEKEAHDRRFEGYTYD